MLEAAAQGLLGASSLLLGAVVGARLRLPTQLVGSSRVRRRHPISAITFELTEEAFKLGVPTRWRRPRAGGDRFLRRRPDDRAERAAAEGPHGGRLRPPRRERHGADAGRDARWNPESAVIGTSLLGGGSVGVPVLVAVFLSNLPEAIGAEAQSPRRPLGRVLAPWVAVVAASTWPPRSASAYSTGRRTISIASVVRPRRGAS